MADRSRLRGEAACVRRTRTTTNGFSRQSSSLSEFEVLMVHAHTPTSTSTNPSPSSSSDEEGPLLVFPGDFVKRYENPQDCALRALKQQAAINGLRAREISIHAHPNRDKDSNTISLLFFVLSRAEEIPENINNKNAAFYSMEDLCAKNSKFRFGFDHRELLYALQGWLRQRELLNATDATFSLNLSIPIAECHNPIFGTPVVKTMDAPTVSWINPHFATGALRPKDPSSTSNGARFIPRRSTHKTIQDNNRPNSLVIDEDLPDGVPEAQRRGGSSSESASESEDSDDIKRSDKRPSGTTTAATITPAAAAARPSISASSAPKSPETVRAAATDSAHAAAASPAAPTPSKRAQQIAVPQVRRPSWLAQMAQMDAEPSSDEEDDVVAALRAVQSGGKKPLEALSEESSRRTSLDALERASFNPLAEDLDADFTNPMFRK